MTDRHEPETADAAERTPLLLVDSDIAFRDAVSGALERFGVATEWRARLLGLFEAVETHDPVALALSLDLPGGDALDVLRALRARDVGSVLPVFLIGTAPTRADVLAAYAEGADAVLERGRAVPEITARVLGAIPRHRRARRSRARRAADEILEMCEASRTATSAAGEVLPPVTATPPAPGPPPVVQAPRVDERRPAVAGTPPAPIPAPPAMPFAFETPAPAAPPVARHTEPGIRPATPVAVPDVILVEDDPSLLEMLRYALSNRGYQTLSFSNGLDALRALREMDTAGRRPVVLLDVDLPGIDGFRVLHELSGSRPGDYQVILCTIHNSEATQVLGIQSGALDYLVKPLRMPIVLAKVERLMGRGSFSAAAHG